MILGNVNFNGLDLLFALKGLHISTRGLRSYPGKIKIMIFTADPGLVYAALSGQKASQGR